MKFDQFRPTLFLAAIALLTGSADTARAQDSEIGKRTEETILAAHVEKWHRLIIRKGTQWPVYHYDNSYYYAIDLEETTRDRAGQGLYVGETRRLLHGYGKLFKLVDRTAKSLRFELHFEGTQGHEDSVVRIHAKEATDAPADDPHRYQVSFSGSGFVYDGFAESLQRELGEMGAWTENLNEIRWQYFPETALEAPEPFYDPKKVLSEISAAYRKVTSGDGIDKRVITFRIPNDPMSGEITIEKFEDDSAMVELSYASGDHGWIGQQFAFNQGRLAFALDQFGSWKFAEGKNAEGEPATEDALREHRYYFHHGHIVRVLEKTANVRNGGDLDAAIGKAKNHEIPPGDRARDVYDQGYALLHIRNSTDAIDHFADGLASRLIDQGRKIAEKEVKNFDAINANGVIGDLDDDGETDVVLIGFREKWKALAILGPLKPGATTSLFELPVVPDQAPPGFRTHHNDIDLAEALGEIPEGFKQSQSATGVAVQIIPETDALHLYWNHRRKQLGAWSL